MNSHESRPTATHTDLSLMGARREYLIFVVAEEPYAVPLASIVEVVPAKRLTHVPRAPADIMGICSVRGELMSVIDVRLRLRRGRSKAERGRILLAFSPVGEKVGLWVDEVRGVQKLAPEEIEFTLGALSAEAGTLSEGIAHLGAEVVVLLNLPSLSA